MAAIFISYRKKSADGKKSADAGRALHLAQDLRAALGQDSVFLDDQEYFFGKFDDFLNDGLRNCRAVVVVIGQAWVDRCQDLLDPGDWVRREIEAGLRRRILMLPVLVDDTTLEQAKKLAPPSIVSLFEYQAVDLDPHHWKETIDLLIEGLSKKLGLERAWTGGAVPNLSGDWIDTEGVHLKLVHRGGEVKIYLLSGGRTMGQGNATIVGNRIQFSIWRPDFGDGTGVGTVSPNGRQVSGSVRYGSRSYGFSISRH